MVELPNSRRWPLLSGPVLRCPWRSKEPKTAATAASATLQQVVDRISANADLSDTRKRDLKSALVSFGKIVDSPLGEIPLDQRSLTIAVFDSPGWLKRKCVIKALRARS